MGSVVLIVIALLLMLAGLGGLFASWRNGAGLLHRLGTPVGWLLLVLSLPPWCVALGVEFGVSYAVLCAGLLAWGFVLLNHELRARRGSALATEAVKLPDSRALGRHVLQFLMSVPLVGLASGFTTTAVMLMLPLGSGNALVAALLLMPLVWGAAAYWVCADPKLFRPALTLLALLLFSTLYLYL